MAENVTNLTGYRKEIDHPLERIAVIERKIVAWAAADAPHSGDDETPTDRPASAEADDIGESPTEPASEGSVERSEA
jgi:hypothetical protein